MNRDGEWLEEVKVSLCEGPDLRQPAVMQGESIPIEIDDGHVYAGRVGQDAYPDQGLPSLYAYRPEPWRFFRLARLLGAAQALADSELGAEAAAAMVAAIVEVSDLKGDFGVVWRLPAHDARYERIVDRALAVIGEEDILHTLESELQE